MILGKNYLSIHSNYSMIALIKYMKAQVLLSNTDEKGKRLESAAAPATVSRDALNDDATGKLGRQLKADELQVRRPACVIVNFLRRGGLELT